MTPSTRNELEDLKARGFTGYLIKPIRAASLAARLQIESDGFAQLPDSEISPHRKGPGRRSGLSILVAEDNEINALLARALLQKLGHRPAVAASGQAAMESFQAAHSAGLPYDLILMDVRMPGIDGLEATRRIRAVEQASGARRTPIVALTANALARTSRGLPRGRHGRLPVEAARSRETGVAALRLRRQGRHRRVTAA